MIESFAYVRLKKHTMKRSFLLDGNLLECPLEFLQWFQFFAVKQLMSPHLPFSEIECPILVFFRLQEHLNHLNCFLNVLLRGILESSFDWKFKTRLSEDLGG